MSKPQWGYYQDRDGVYWVRDRVGRRAWRWIWLHPQHRVWVVAAGSSRPRPRGLREGVIACLPAYDDLLRQEGSCDE